MSAVYNPAAIAKRSTEWLEAKVAECERNVKARGNGSRGEAYYKQVAREQAVRSLALYSAALRDRKAGLV